MMGFVSHEVQRQMIFFFRIFEIIICDLVNAVEATCMYGLPLVLIVSGNLF